MFLQIRELRIKRGLTQFDIAEKMRCGVSAVSMWETGARNPPTDKLPELARILGCTIDDLFRKGN